MKTTTTHPCPGHCGRLAIAHNKLACEACWRRLPVAYRDDITFTYGIRWDETGRRAHHDATANALRWYRDQVLRPARAGEL